MTSSIESAVSSSGSDRRIVVSALGVTQIFAWGSSYYLLAVLAKPIAAETGWPLSWVIGGVSLGLLLAGLISPLVGRTIERKGGRSVLATSAALLASGLLALAYSRGLYGYLGAWVMIGLGMGAGLLRSSVFHLGAHLWAIGAAAHHCRDAVWRICEHRLLAAHSASRSPLGMAGDLRDLCFRAAPVRAADPFMGLASAGTLNHGFGERDCFDGCRSFHL